MSRFSITVGGDSLVEMVANLGEAANAFGGPIPVAVVAETLTATAQALVAAPKPVRTRTRPEAAAVPVVAPATAPAAVEGVTKEAVVKKLVTLINANDALGRNGKQVCTDLCMKFGGKNASAADPSKYGQIVEAVDKALEALNEDPTA
jgi:hypothetical protein